MSFKIKNEVKTKLIKGFLIWHLLVVVLGSGLIRISNKTLEGGLLRYSSWTGGGFGYSFFSPNVGNQTVIKTYTMTNGNVMKQDAFGTGDNLFDCRFSAVIHTFRNQKAYELMSRIVASYLFAKYPGSGPAFISVGEYVPQSMAEYRTLQKESRFREIYNGTYTLK